MGIAQAGFAFRSAAPIEDLKNFVANLCGSDVVQIEHPNRGEFDTRNDLDIMVEVFDNVYFVCNSAMSWKYLEHQNLDHQSVFAALGMPAFFMAFCHFDTGSSYGYALFEDGVRTRSILNTMAAPRLPPVIESGDPKDFEMRWSTANFYLDEDDCPREEWQKIYFQGNREIEMPEHQIPARLLYEAMQKYLGVYPWDFGSKQKSYFFRKHVRHNSWWKFW